MFKEIFRFELTSAFRKPMVYIFTIVNFILVFIASVSDTVIIGGGNDAININAPHVIMTTTLFMTLIGVFMTTAFMNSSMLKDYQYNFHGLLFSSSISKLGYLGGRFLATYILSLIPFIGVLAGIAVAGSIGIVDPDSTGVFNFSTYASVFLFAVMPNIFLLSAIIFLLTATFKSSMYSFIGALAVLVLYIVMGSTTNNLDNEMIAVISDPLGISSYDILTKYSTIEEKNSQLITFSGMWMVNRLLWTGFAVALLLLTYFRFSFARKKEKVSKIDNLKATSNPFTIIQKHVALPEVLISESNKHRWALFLHQTWMEMKGVVKSAPFIIITLIGVFNMMSLISLVDQRYGTGNYPVTYLIIDAIRGALYIYLIAIITYYAGALIWKERDAKMNELIDTTPFSTWMPYLSKLIALVSIITITLCIGIGCGIIIQTLKGYTNYELGVYVQELLVYDLLRFIGLIALGMFVQTIINNKYIGYFAFLLTIIAFKFGPQALDISSNLISFGSLPNYIYSDMNGWNVYSDSLTWFSTYWTLFAALLTAGGILFWARGLEHEWSLRLRAARSQFNGNLAFITLALAILWVSTSSFLYYQTQIVNVSDSSHTALQKKYDYEMAYKQYEHITQPRIIAVDYAMDIFPNDRAFNSIATVTIQNKTIEPITEIHFSVTDEYNIDISIPNSEIKVLDTQLDYQIHALHEALGPGERRTIQVKSNYSSTGIENEISNTNVVANGTFLNSKSFMPKIGYSSSKELSKDADRADFNLDPKPTKKKLHSGCSAACGNNYISQDADWVNLTTTISTSSDQVAIAPGSLIESWEEGNRNYYQYKLEHKAVNFFSFISARYEISRDVWIAQNGQKVDVEVYYHKGHEYNVAKMTEVIKNSLTYYTNNFTPYPHQQARIIEFPRYESFAQAFPGTMPYSESIGFLADLKDDSGIDMVTYIVAHEMAHQWWAHQVIGANVQGATMLSETFSQYSALMVMKAMYGNDKMKQFMRYEMDAYLKGRATEDKEELPLLYNENQSYVHYEKGSVVMYALQDYIGEDNVNRAMKSFAEAKAYQEAPYTNTLEFMDYLNAATPDSLQYLLHDMIETITMYNNKTVNAEYKVMANGQYEVTIDVKVAKYVADGQGKETKVAHDDYIDIGVFSKEPASGEKYGRPILIERVKINRDAQSFTFIVDEKPYSAGIDPNYLLVDRMPEDNVKVFTKQ